MRKFLDSLVFLLMVILFWGGGGYFVYTRYLAPDYKITGFGNVKLGKKMSGFTRDTDFLSFEKFGCRVTAKSSKCYSIYYMFEEKSDSLSTGESKNRPNIHQIISALMTKYNNPNDSRCRCLSLLHDPMPARNSLDEVYDTKFFSDREIEWIEVCQVFDSANSGAREIVLCVSGDPEIGRRAEIKHTYFHADKPSSQKYRVLLYARDRHLQVKNQKEKTEDTCDGL